jgi:hypothetical protein
VEKSREGKTLMQVEKTDRSANHVPADEGRSFWLLTDLHTFKAVGEDAGGAFALSELMQELQVIVEKAQKYGIEVPPPPDSR